MVLFSCTSSQSFENNAVRLVWNGEGHTYLIIMTIGIRLSVNRIFPVKGYLVSFRDGELETVFTYYCPAVVDGEGEKLIIS